MLLIPDDATEAELLEVAQEQRTLRQLGQARKQEHERQARKCFDGVNWTIVYLYPRPESGA
jgi:hypothetical protein